MSQAARGQELSGDRAIGPVVGIRMRSECSVNTLTIVGARVIVRRDARIAKKKEMRALALIIAGVAGPFLLAFLLIAADMKSDLSGLRSRPATAGSGVALVGWRDLDVDEMREHQQGRAELPAGRIRMLGYMMDGYRPVPDGTAVSMFMLMPEAGQLLHPAHRIPDQMVEIRLDDGRTLPYADRSLVWVEGNLQRIRGKAVDGLALYAIEHVIVERASERDITR